jgi:hypothetical protein
VGELCGECAGGVSKGVVAFDDDLPPMDVPAIVEDITGGSAGECSNTEHAELLTCR